MADVRVKTTGKVAMMAHCLLNQNSKPYMRARFPGIADPVLDVLREEGYALFQLPCPEVGHAGLSRFSQVIEQYDTARYRAHCRDLAVRVVDQVDHYPDYGYSLVILGIDGSPSCGIRMTGTDPEWRGYPGEAPIGEAYPIAEGSGIFMQELKKEMEGRGLDFPPAIGVGLDVHGIDLQTVKDALRKELQALSD